MMKKFLEYANQTIAKEDIPENKALDELNLQWQLMSILLRPYPRKVQKEIIMFMRSINLLEDSQVTTLLQYFGLKNE